MRWLQSFTGRQDHLIHQGAYADWADSIARRGAVLYTNVVYWQALQRMATLADELGYPGEARLYRESATRLKQDLNQQLWLPQAGFFATNAEYANLSSAGNLLAVAWGLASEAQSHTILDAIAAAGMTAPVPTRAAYPAYRRQDIALENRLGGLANYHTEGAWLWIGAWHLVALCRLGRLAEAQVLLGRIVAVVTRDQQIHEVYGPDGQPLSSFWYTSEAPLTWNAGMLVYAFHVLGHQDQGKGKET
jgi:GH15 family glucan-1,4-alpha-glucosidase